MTTSLGFGFFHSAVEVFGREWQFGGNQDAAPEDCGVFFLPPEVVMPPQQVYEVKTLGYLPLEATNSIIEAAIRATLIPHWTALSYHVLSHNCNHFSEALIGLLNQTFGTNMEFPAYINRAARFGDVFVPDSILMQMMQQAPQAPSQGGGNATDRRASAAPPRKMGKNPTVTRADGKHYTIDGVPLRDIQGWSGATTGGRTGCNCGNPYCRSNASGAGHRQAADNGSSVDAVPPIPPENELRGMSVKSIKTVMWLNGISWEGCFEKSDLINAIKNYTEEAGFAS